MLKAGDIVFTEAEVWTATRKIIRKSSGGGRTVHAAIAEGKTTYVFESVRGGGGLRRHYLSPDDSYTVYRHRQREIGQLMAVIAEGYVAEREGSGGKYGKYSIPKLILARGRKGRGGEREQWGAKRTSKFYCSNFVTRVLMAAQQAAGGGVYHPGLNTHISPAGLKEFLASDPYWVPVM
jgi:hypothetical protein